MIRTGYSFKTAVGDLADVAARIGEIGWKVAPICDRNSTFGYVRWRDSTKTGPRPVYGVELAVSPSYGERQPALDWWTFLALDDLRPLHELVHEATKNPSAALSYQQALAAEGVTKIAGPSARMDLLPEDGSVPVALCPGLPRGQLRAARERGLRLVARPNNFFCRPEDRELYRVAMGKQASSQTFPQWIVSDVEYAEAVARGSGATEKEVTDAIAERDRLLDLSRAELRAAAIVVPEKPKTLRQMCVEGARRLGISLREKVYRERLDRELEMIARKEFEDYFYIVSDMVRWAKERMVVGPARGSSCGSLVCYLLDITAVDPIRHDLLFERFIDVTRADLPDIDLDFSDQRRDQVFRYVEERYGRDHVARLGSVMMFKPKSILARIGVALRIPTWQVDELANTVVKRSMGDSRASSTIMDTFRDTEVGQKMLDEYPEAAIASRMEGQPNAAGQHAAGVVITQDPIASIVAVDGRNGATMCDKRDAERLNLLKIDMLGLTQLGVFERVLELIGEKGLSRFLEKIPADDPAAYEVLNDFRFSGIFQFVPGSTSQALVTRMRNVYGARIDKFQDIVDLTALVRPGPLGSGQTDRWLLRRGGKEPVTYFHEAIRPHVEETLGMIVYQEQVMQIGRQVGDLTWDDVTALRKAMSKSLGREYFDKFGDRWKVGAAKRGMNKEARDKMWDDICQFGLWAFNKSHSVAYATVSYWCMWLKAHHPLEFAAATLDAEGDTLAQITLLRELRTEGVDYVPIDPDHSTDRWQVVGGKLVGPLTAIKGIGPAKVRIILDNRERNKTLPRSERKPLPPGLRKMLEACRTEIDSLTPIEDAIRRNHPDLRAIGITTTPTLIGDILPGKQRGPVVVTGIVKRIGPQNENEPVLVAKRGYALSGPVEVLKLTIRDDYGADIFCKISRWDFPRLGRPTLEKARAGKSLYAVKGTVPDDFRMIRVTAIKYLGEMDDKEQDGIQLEGGGGHGDLSANDEGGQAGDGYSRGDRNVAQLGDRAVAPGRDKKRGRARAAPV